MERKNNTHFLKLLKVLSNSTRFNVVLLLASGEKCVCNIFEHLKLSQNLVSHHLGILRRGGVIISRKEGKWVHYRLNKKTIYIVGQFSKMILKPKKNDSKC